MSIQITGHMRLVGPAGVAEASDLPGRQGRLVLAALGLAERAVAREVLAECVWGAAPTRSWERDLSALVSKLRAVLARTGLEGAATIRSDGASYELETGPGAEIDVRRGRAAADELEAATAGGAHAAAAEAAAEVLAVTARPLLAGEDAPWIDEARAELARLRVRALDGAARADLARGLEDAAREHVREALELEPFRESTHRLLMDVELAAGNRGEAVRAYERLRELLADELGVDPSPESEARYLEALRVVAAPATTATASAPSPAPTSLEVPPIRYARSGRVNIAYQVVGSGPVDLVMVPGWVSNLELAWHEPRMAGFLRRLADRCRLILFDKRGTGLSDPVPIDEPPPLEVRMDDVRAVMDAADVERAVVLGFSEGGAMSLLFAATHPERTAGLALWGTWCRQLRGEDFPLGWTREQGLRRFVRPIQRTGTPPLKWFAPSMLGDAAFEAWFDRYARQSASPGMAIALLRANAPMDLREVLPTIRVPTLVLHRADDVLVEVGQGRYLAEHIPGARIVEFPGTDHWPWIGDGEPIVAALLDFVASCTTATPPVAEVLASVVVAALPADADAAAARSVVEGADGRLVDLRDGALLARFDGPGRALASAQQLVARWGEVARVAVHTGPVRTENGDIGGTAVELARRAVALAAAGEVLVTRTVTDLLAGAGHDLAHRGELAAEELAAPLDVFALR